MRFAALLLAVSPSFVFADTITTRTTPTDVTVYTDGVALTRTGVVTLPAGRHTLLLSDLFPDTADVAVDIKLPGATILATEWQLSNLGPKEHPQTPELIAADAALETAKDALQAHKDKIATAQLAGTAAEAQIAFLKDLSKSTTLPEGIDSLRDLSRMISEETLTAQAAIQRSAVEVRELSKEIDPLQDDVTRAQLAQDALLPYDKGVAHLSIEIDVPTATDTTLSLTHAAYGAWAPTYDLRLDTTGDTPKLTMERGAIVNQTSGMDWTGVNMTLSSLSLENRPYPIAPKAKRLWISDPKVQRKVTLQSDRMQLSSLAEPIIEAPVMIEEAAGGVYISGIAAAYGFDHKVDVNGRGDDVRLSLGTLSFDVEMTATAAPLNDDTAYRMVTLTNTSGERILPSYLTNIYVDGTFVNVTLLEEVVAGGETQIGFGPIHGIRLTRTILNRNEGDRGIISRSNEKTEDIRIDVENLTGEDWVVNLLDRVPYTEQEDLSITSNASPRATTENYEDQRGILHWEMEMDAGAKQSISLKTKITWPEGMILR